MTTSLEELNRKERSSWCSVVAIALGGFSLVIAELLPVGLLTEISKDLQVTEGTAGLMVTGTGLLAAIGAPVITIAIAVWTDELFYWDLLLCFLFQAVSQR
ncbi:hypothetical protein [Paenibacillus sp. J2TS4]|uniref:hypothetical protein n=1 Tax=Paenibacillus sp. J2TS4 TaxID=2807194 RepID=UPI001B1ED257|nr:hypothetical protein [Paenibacillus sp. J2TS4]GIP31693.1 hypothetical protein J2TS4_09030 [Paenibacillus sp. J2TS4]